MDMVPGIMGMGIIIPITKSNGERTHSHEMFTAPANLRIISVKKRKEKPRRKKQVNIENQI